MNGIFIIFVIVFRSNKSCMTTIYFDQFAISSMSGSIISDIWSKIRQILLDLKSQDKICCCTSLETIMETSQRHHSGVVDNYAIISELMDNCYLNDMRMIICQQMARSIKGIESNPFIQVDCNYTSDEFNFNLKEAIRCEFASTDVFSYPVDIPRNKMHSMLELYMSNRKKIFIDSIDSFLEGREHNSFYTDICSILIERFNFMTADLIQLRNRIGNNNLAISPTLTILNKLEPFIFFSEYRRKTKIDFKNDLLDIRRLSSAIPYCDVILCDSKWKNCIRELNIGNDKKFFSAKPVDLSGFNHYLSNIKNA